MTVCRQMQINLLLWSMCIKISIQHSTTCDSRTNLNYITNTHPLVIPTEALTSIFKSSLYYFTKYIIHVRNFRITCLKHIYRNYSDASLQIGWHYLNILNMTWCWQDLPWFSIPSCSKKMAKSGKLLDMILDYNIWNRNGCKYSSTFAHINVKWM